VEAAVSAVPTIRAEARRLTAGKAKPAVVEALYARVAQGVRSLEQPLADSGYRGRAPAQTLAEGEGDAISKHVLLAALLASQGIQCDAVFVSASGTLDVDFPSPGQLDGVVSRVESGKQSTWLDAGLEVARAGALAPDLRGRRGLAVSARGSQIVQVPEAPPGFNYVRAVWSGTLDANGNVNADLRVELRGDFEAVLRRAFRDGSAEADTQIHRLLMEPFGTHAATHSEIFDLRGPLVVETHAYLRQFVQPLTKRAGADFQAVNYGQDCHCTAAQKDPPASPAQHDPPALKPPYTVEEVFELKVPEGVMPILPPATNRSGVAGAVRSSTEFANGVLRLHRTVEVRSDDGPEGQMFAASLMFDLARNQVLEHTGAIDVDAVLKGRSNYNLDSEGYDAVDRNPELARVILEYATRRNPQSQYSWYNLGRTYEALGRREDAVKAYDKQIEVNPKDEWSYYGRGLVLSRMKRYREAIPWFERQLNIVTDSQLALRDLGHSYRGYLAEGAGGGSRRFRRTGGLRAGAGLPRGSRWRQAVFRARHPRVPAGRQQRGAGIGEMRRGSGLCTRPGGGRAEADPGGVRRHARPGRLGRGRRRSVDRCFQPRCPGESAFQGKSGRGGGAAPGCGWGDGGG
jgi:hypothetical protein